MAIFATRNNRRVHSNTLVARLLRRFNPPPGTFKCGTRSPADADPKRRKWRYRRAWVDPLRQEGVIRVRFDNADELHVRLDQDPWWQGGGPATQSDLVVLSLHDAGDGQPILLAVPPGALAKFDLGGL